MRFYTLKDFVVLDEVGYIIYQPSTPNVPIDVPCIGLTQEAFDYYDYRHSRGWRRWISDVWDKTEKHWLTLLFGWVAGVPGCLTGCFRSFFGDEAAKCDKRRELAYVICALQANLVE